MNEYRNLVKTLSTLFDSLQPRLVYRPALLGDGLGNISVTNRVGYSYVRLFTDPSKRMEVFGMKTHGYDGMPVIVGELPWQPGMVQIIDVDWKAFLDAGDSWLDEIIYVSTTPLPHGATHHSLSFDPADIDKQNLRELKMSWGSGAWDINVDPDFYPYRNTRRYFPGGSIDLANYHTGIAHFVTVYIDRETNDLAAINGALLTGQSLFGVNLDIATSFPIPPAESVVVGTFYYAGTGSGQRYVNLTGVYLDRTMWGVLGGAASYGFGGIPQSVGASNAEGSGTSASRNDHVHQGIHSIGVQGFGSLYGDVTLLGSTGISLAHIGNSILLSLTGSMGGAVSVSDLSGFPLIAQATQLKFSSGTVYDLGGGIVRVKNYWEPVTNGQITGTEILFAHGDVLMVGH